MIEFIQQEQVCFIKGELVQEQVISLWPKRRELFSLDTQILDVSGIDYVDSAGVALLLELARFTHKGSPKRQSPRVLANPSNQLNSMIELYDLDIFLQQQENVAPPI